MNPSHLPPPQLPACQVHALADSHDEARYIAQQIQAALRRCVMAASARQYGSRLGARTCLPGSGAAYLPVKPAELDRPRLPLTQRPQSLALPAYSGEHPQDQIAVLFRTHIQARLVEQELVRLVWWYGVWSKWVEVGEQI